MRLPSLLPFFCSYTFACYRYPKGTCNKLMLKKLGSRSRRSLLSKKQTLPYFWVRRFVYVFGISRLAGNIYHKEMDEMLNCFGRRIEIRNRLREWRCLDNESRTLSSWLLEYVNYGFQIHTSFRLMRISIGTWTRDGRSLLQTSGFSVSASSNRS